MLRMACTVPNLKQIENFQKNLGLCYFDFISKSVSQFDFKKSPIQVPVIPTLNKLQVSKQILVAFGVF